MNFTAQRCDVFVLGLSSESDSESCEATDSSSSSSDDSDLEEKGEDSRSSRAAKLSFATSFIEVKRKELAEAPKGKKG